jgi:hypothetical protein
MVKLLVMLLAIHSGGGQQCLRTMMLCCTASSALQVRKPLLPATHLLLSHLHEPQDDVSQVSHNWLDWLPKPLAPYDAEQQLKHLKQHSTAQHGTL